MGEIQCSLETALEIEAMSVPSKVIRLDSSERAAPGSVRTILGVWVSGFPRHGKEITEGPISRR